MIKTTETRPVTEFPARACLAGLMLAAALTLGSAATRAQTLTTDQENQENYAPGQDIVVTFDGGPGNAKDWIGIYPEGATPGDVGSTLWFYVDGTQDGLEGLGSGSVTFIGGLDEVGSWDVHFLENDGYTSLAMVTITVAPDGPTIATDRSSYDPEEAIVVTFEGGPGNAKDWIAVYPEGATPGDVNSTLWFYVDGTQDGAEGFTDGSVTFEDGLTEEGGFVAYLLLDDGYDVLASQAFEVRKASLVLSNHSDYFPNEPIEVSWFDGPGNPADWIGIYPVDVVPGSVGSTDWRYVGGTQTPGDGLREGTVSFPGGLPLAGDYQVYLLLDDGYTILGGSTFSIVDPFFAVLRTEKRVFSPGEPITVGFLNGYENAKDWIGIYESGQIPGEVDSTIWFYADGTQTGETPLFEGSVVFETGLETPGTYDIQYLLDDGYFILATETIIIRDDVSTPVLVSTNPGADNTGVSPAPRFSASIRNRLQSVADGSVMLTLDGVTVETEVVVEEDLVTVRYEGAELFAPLSGHTYVLTYRDDADPANDYSLEIPFTVSDYIDRILPEPIVFEDFESTPEGELPVGWTEESYTTVANEDFDLGNLDSAAYATWVVVDASRFEDELVTYSAGTSLDYQRVLTPNPNLVVNGMVVDGPLAEGHFVFGNAGYRNGAGQALFLHSPDFDLTGREDVSVAFHSLWEQNQDSMAAIEYSIDQGTTWMPIAYFLDGPDILLDDQENIDAAATFEAVYGDVPDLIEGELVAGGGSYGLYIGAPISQDLAPFIHARVDDDPAESKRLEVFRLDGADNQSTVRFRFAHAGADSWYFGIDNFGLYSIPSTEAPRLAVSVDDTELTLSWDPEAGEFVLESTDGLRPANWTPVEGAANGSVTLPLEGDSRYFRLRQ